ncbi:DUF1499 domain-containing protein [Psychromonas sp.]|uniref:DUF1499 domain-containing protein n=1 Tax=Psychromonas sp. TaxID=1884585 RepID=UPI0035627566
MKKAFLIVIIFFMNMHLAACSEKSPGDIAQSAEIISLCPAYPNCVSSDATDGEHQIAPYLLTQEAETVWAVVQEIIEQQPGCIIIEQTQYFLHVECRSALFRFVDDLKLELRTEQNIIAVYSASRLGYSDFGVNRKRIESLRAVLKERGQIK